MILLDTDIFTLHQLGNEQVSSRIHVRGWVVHLLLGKM
jgi:hypothetical protein